MTMFDIASIKPPRGQMDGSGKFSPNLYQWVRTRWGAQFGGRGLEQEPEVYRDGSGTLWIGRIDDGGMFVGHKLWRVLCAPNQEIYAWTRRSHPKIRLIKNFWRDYRKHGRCAIDRHTSSWWDQRWTVSGKTRTCQWCGKHKQKLHIKTRVERHVEKTWVPVQAAA